MLEPLKILIQLKNFADGLKELSRNLDEIVNAMIA